MRFNLTLQIIGSGRTIPINYQYALHSWIYRVIQRADAEFSHFLHEQGYQQGEKRFKLFTFSQLTGKPFRLFKEEQRIAFYGTEGAAPQLRLAVSFWLPEAAENFIRGLFLGQRFSLGDVISQAEMEVERIEAMPRPVFGEVMQYQAVTPVVVSIREPDRKHPQYLPPDNEIYTGQLMKNLQHKAEAARLTVPMVAIAGENKIWTDGWRMKRTSPFRKRGITVKQYTTMQNKIIGYTYDVELTAPPKIQQLAYYAGLGEDNSMGFGFLEIK